MASEFSVFYQKFDAPFDAPEGQNALYIEFRYSVGGAQVVDHLYIADFDDGDFGIQFQNLSTFTVPPDAGGGTLTYNTPSHVAYINNYGSYATVPDRISDEDEQQMAPRSVFASSAPSAFAAYSNNEGERDKHSIYVDTAVASYHNEYHVSANSGHPWSAEQFEIGKSSSGFADAADAVGFDPGHPLANSFGDIWYEPEPIGGLV